MKHFANTIALCAMIALTSYAIVTAAFWAYLNLIPPMQIDASTSVLTPRSTLTVQSSDSTALQPSGAVYEDETTATMLVQPADYSKQTTKHYWFLQPTEWRYEVTYDVSLAEDVTLDTTRTPLVVNGSVYNVQGVRF